jgi:hypothetical protein
MISRSLLALGTVGLLSLVGCSGPADQASNPSSVVDKAATDATTAAGTAAGAAKDGAVGAAGAMKDGAMGAADAAKDGAMGAAGAAKDAAASGMAAVTGGAGEMMSVVTNTKTAVEAGDFAKAKEEFAKFEDSWKKVEDGVKTTSPKAYDAIEGGLGTVTSALGEANPDKTKVMDALTSLTTSITSVAKP